MKSQCKFKIDILILLSLCCVFFSASNVGAAEEKELWAALRNGSAFAIMRHAIAPGVGDSANFDVNDCATQRNLSDEGRKQASKIGDRIRRHGINNAAVFSSAWCRCRETAELLKIGDAFTLISLNSFYRNSSQRGPQTKALRVWLEKYEIRSPLFLVTHNVNIRALTGVFTSQGEIVVVKRNKQGELDILGTL